MMMKKRFKRKRGPVRAKKVTYDGITFASGLEKYMYIALQKAKIKTAYEGVKKSLVLSILLILLVLQMKLLLSVKDVRTIRFQCVGNCLKNT